MKAPSKRPRAPFSDLPNSVVRPLTASLSPPAQSATPTPPHFRAMYQHATLTPAQHPDRHAVLRRHLLRVDGTERRRSLLRRTLLGSAPAAPALSLGSLGSHVGVDYVEVADAARAAWVVGVLKRHPGWSRANWRPATADARSLSLFSASLLSLQTSPGPSWTRPLSSTSDVHHHPVRRPARRPLHPLATRPDRPRPLDGVTSARSARAAPAWARTAGSRGRDRLRHGFWAGLLPPGLSTQPVGE